MPTTLTTPVSANTQQRRRADAVVASLDLPSGPDTFAVLNPAVGETITTLADQTAAEALEYVARAERAGRDWRRLSARARSEILHGWYELIIENRDDLALLITLEMGKPLAESASEVAYGADFVRWYAEEAVRPQGGFSDLPGGGASLLTRKAPVGLSVLITPWNFPLAMATRKLAPALAAGCAAVIKPANLTPLTTFLAVSLAHRAGVPEDLIHVVATTKAPAFSEALLADRRVRKVSFTGSTEVGRVLLRLASQNVLRSSMELGGNAPLIVFDDADLERAIAGSFAAKMRNGGQSCIAANRIFVQDGIADEFVAGLTEKMNAMVIGDGLGPNVTHGPLIDERAVNKMETLVADAITRGADLLAGGSAVEGPGNFFLPTVLDNVPPAAEIARGEIFGPIAAIQRFTTEDEVVTRSNDSIYGLAGYVFTQDIDRALNVADNLHTGLVGINQGVPSNAAAPFGGVKQSGLGREGSAEGLEEYQETRFYNVARRTTT